ncbi:uncharacterized protein FYW49_001630 [Xenentodon cancila]
MLKPENRGDYVESDPPSVFGKPWYWQRSSSTTESSRSLAQVIMEMRDELKKLETENRELRGEHSQRPFGTLPAEAGLVSSAGKEQAETVENPYVNLRRNASAPVLERQYKENTVMTVRRYSTNSNLSGVIMTEGRIDKSRHNNNSGWGRLQEEIQRGKHVFGNSSNEEMEKLSNRRTLQEFVHENRVKVKTVTFLLPVDDIYTNRPVLTKQQKEPKISDLPSIMVTDS